MRIVGAMLANEAVMDDGLVNVVGGGWRFVARSEFPATVSGYVVGVVELGLDSPGPPILRLSVSANGHEAWSLGSIVIEAFGADDLPTRTAFALPFSFAIPTPGTVEFTLSGDGVGDLDTISLPITRVS